MRTDERIALLDQMRRVKEQGEKEVQAPEEKTLTLEDALAALSEGKLELEDGRLLEFEICPYFKEEFPFICFKGFYQASQEDESGRILVNHTEGVSQIINWTPQKRAAKTLEQWSNLLVNGMAANRLSAQILKKKSLETVEYFCFEVPAGEKRVWNILFRFKTQWMEFTGNYNCLKEDVGTYGILLEAMVVKLDEWMRKREGACADGRSYQGV